MVDQTEAMAGKVVLITGGTGGIGKATAIGLAAQGARVAITGRDSAARPGCGDRRSAARQATRRWTRSPLTCRRRPRSAASPLQVLEAYPRLDVLINNVGGFWATRHVTADGLERTFAVNHLAAFLLTDLLLDRLKASAPARVVTVSSGAQSLGAIDFGDLQGERDYSGQTAYNQSKLASVMFTYELARRLRGTGVTATALHPGVVSTGFGAEDPSRIFRFLVPLLRPFMKTPEQGAATSIYLASSPKVEGVTGSFFVTGRPRTSNKASYDNLAAARLWTISAGLVGRSGVVADAGLGRSPRA